MKSPLQMSLEKKSLASSLFANEVLSFSHVSELLVAVFRSRPVIATITQTNKQTDKINDG